MNDQGSPAFSRGQWICAAISAGCMMVLCAPVFIAAWLNEDALYRFSGYTGQHIDDNWFYLSAIEQARRGSWWPFLIRSAGFPDTLQLSPNLYWLFTGKLAALLGISSVAAMQLVRLGCALVCAWLVSRIAWELSGRKLRGAALIIPCAWLTPGASWPALLGMDANQTDRQFLELTLGTGVRDSMFAPVGVVFMLGIAWLLYSMTREAATPRLRDLALLGAANLALVFIYTSKAIPLAAFQVIWLLARYWPPSTPGWFAICKPFAAAWTISALIAMSAMGAYIAAHWEMFEVYSGMDEPQAFLPPLWMIFEACWPVFFTIPSLVWAWRRGGAWRAPVVWIAAMFAIYTLGQWNLAINIRKHCMTLIFTVPAVMLAAHAVRRRGLPGVMLAAWLAISVINTAGLVAYDIRHFNSRPAPWFRPVQVEPVMHWLARAGREGESVLHSPLLTAEVLAETPLTPWVFIAGEVAVSPVLKGAAALKQPLALTVFNGSPSAFPHALLCALNTRFVISGPASDPRDPAPVSMDFFEFAQVGMMDPRYENADNLRAVSGRWAREVFASGPWTIFEIIHCPNPPGPLPPWAHELRRANRP
ncbi:MAG: hypothetical protein GMKNLPBB_03038 [Myxococcota bacterium]|nr:hypothetical protein [Myxococcota bacterium]